MDLSLSGRVAVVAGSSKGIGRAVAVELCREGARVVVNGRDPEAVAATVDVVTGLGSGEAIGVVADVATSEGAQRLIDKALQRFGALDVLVTNAGGPRAGNFEDLTDEDFEAGFRLNLLSTVRMIRAALPHLERSDAARIINLQSTAIKEPVPQVTLTNSIRPGVVGLSKDLANQLGPRGITVNTVLSGPVLTDRLRYTSAQRAAAAGISPEQQLDRYLELVPLGRWGEPEDVAGMIVFLASARAAWITGIVVQVDGGRVRSAT
jgi:3-oxoacyl-[acyl-carrier protein] reductase